MGRGMSCVEVGDSDSESERERCRWCDLRICLCNQRMVLRLAPRRISCRRSANGSGGMRSCCRSNYTSSWRAADARMAGFQLNDVEISVKDDVYNSSN